MPGPENEGPDCTEWEMKDQANSDLSAFLLLVFLFNVIYAHWQNINAFQFQNRATSKTDS